LSVITDLENSVSHGSRQVITDIAPCEYAWEFGRIWEKVLPTRPAPRVTATAKIFQREVLAFRVQCSGFFPLFSTRLKMENLFPFDATPK
jgi:hypothetical protein